MARLAPDIINVSTQHKSPDVKQTYTLLGVNDQYGREKLLVAAENLSDIEYGFNLLQKGRSNIVNIDYFVLQLWHGGVYVEYISYLSKDEITASVLQTKLDGKYKYP